MTEIKLIMPEIKLKPIHVKLDPNKEEDVQINAFLEGKPKSYIVKQALLAYMKDKDHTLSSELNQTKY